VTVGLVTVHEIRFDHLVDDWHGLRICSAGTGLIAGLDGFENLFDSGAQKRTAACIVQSVLLSLARALASLSSIGQVWAPVELVKDGEICRCIRKLSIPRAGNRVDASYNAAVRRTAVIFRKIKSPR
jgi:hypothetical protein